MAETVSVFVPLLFLVVTELSSIAREINLKNSINRKPLVLGFAPEFVEELNEFLTVPKLGHFNFIHGANFVLLSLGMFMVVILSDSIITYILATMIWIVWALLPIFEVSEYESILDNGKPFSFVIHVFLTTICAGFIVGVAEFANYQSLNQNAFLGVTMFNWLFYVFCLLVFVSNRQFLMSLEDEVEDISNDTDTDSA